MLTKEQEDRLIEKAHQFYHKHVPSCTKQLANFNANEFVKIASLYTEKMPISDDDWEKYIQASKKSKTIQMAIVSHPDVPSHIIDKMFQEIGVYASVCEYLFFSDKELSKEVAAVVCQKANSNRLLKTRNSSVTIVENPQCANIIANSLYRENALNNHDKLLDFQIDALRTMNDNALAKSIVEETDIDERFSQYICENKNLSEEIRKTAYEKGINYLSLNDIPKSISDDIYKTAIDTIFDESLENSLKEDEFYNIKKNYIGILCDLAKKRYLNNGQIRNILVANVEHNPMFERFFESVALNAQDEDIIKETYQITRDLEEKERTYIDKWFMDNQHLPEELILQYTQKFISVLENDYKCGSLVFSSVATFARMARSCAFTKEIEEMLLNIKTANIDKDAEIYSFYIIGGFLMNENVSEKVLKKFENWPNKNIRLKARIIKEAQKNDSFKQFYIQNENLRNVLLVYDKRDEFKEIIKNIYTNEELRRNYGGTDSEIDMFQNEINDVLMTFGIKEPTENFLLNATTNILNYIRANDNQCCFYVRLNECIDMLAEYDEQIEKLGISWHLIFGSSCAKR